MQIKPSPQSWDIFCRVIDNYGDIGVCWRLAKQLAKEYPLKVRLWVDELPALMRLWPEAADTDRQLLEQVEVRRWKDVFPSTPVAEVVIEAFACDLPSTYLTSMKASACSPVWINLDYLSAETWVEDCHGLTSVHPSLGLKKTFFFPGFTAKTGGLLREANLAQEQKNFAQSAGKIKFLQGLGLTLDPSRLLISLFSYENPAVTSLVNAWQNSSQPITCVVPEGKVLGSINQAFHQSLAVGDLYSRGSLIIKVIPFLKQNDYDHLLWACDINFVRGEDSFVRAQWAGKPMVWHIYPQEDSAHLHKLNAFLNRYLATSDTVLAATITDLWHLWNQGGDCALAWNRCLASLSDWQLLGNIWREELSVESDLAANLVEFCQKPL